MPNEQYFRNPRQPVKMAAAFVILLACLLSPIPTAGLSATARTYIGSFALVIGAWALMWIMRNRYDRCYLLMTEQGIMKNGLIRYAIPWDAIHGFDLYTRQNRHTTDDLLYVLISDLGAISHKGPLSWLAHQIPLLLARLREFDGVYRRTLKIYGADSPEAAQALQVLRSALEARQSPAVKRPESIQETGGEIKLPCQTSIWFVVTIIPVLALVIFIFVALMQDASTLRDLRMMAFPMVIILSIPYLLQGIRHRPYLVTDGDGVTLDHRAKSQFIPWNAIGRIRFMDKKNGSGETFLRYDVLIFEITDKSRIITKGDFGPLSEFIHRFTLPYRPARLKEEPACIYRPYGRRFPKDLAERLTLRRQRALAK